MVKVDTPRRVGLAVLALCLVQFIDVLGVTVVVTALPAMLTDLRAPADAASLISAGYAMFFGGLLMTGARPGDRFGHRRTILAGLLVFAVAAVIGATAASAAVLTAARCLQGAAVLLLVAALTSGLPGPGRPVPAVAWGLAATISLAGAAVFAWKDRAHQADRHGNGPRETEIAVC